MKGHKENILQHLKNNGSITSMQAIMTYGCTRLSAIIFRLRKDGHYITSINKSGTHHVTGRKTTYSVYYYHSEKPIANSDSQYSLMNDKPLI